MGKFLRNHPKEIFQDVGLNWFLRFGNLAMCWRFLGYLSNILDPHLGPVSGSAAPNSPTAGGRAKLGPTGRGRAQPRALRRRTMAWEGGFDGGFDHPDLQLLLFFWEGGKKAFRPN